jgi:hypothetical protein
MKRFIQPRISRVNIARLGLVYRQHAQQGDARSTIAGAALKRGRSWDSRSLVLQIAPRLLIVARSRAIVAPHEQVRLTSQQPTAIAADIDAVSAAPAVPAEHDLGGEQVDVPAAPSFEFEARAAGEDSWPSPEDIVHPGPEIHASRRPDREPRVVALARSIARVMASPFSRSDEDTDIGEHDDKRVEADGDDSVIADPSRVSADELSPPPLPISHEVDRSAASGARLAPPEAPVPHAEPSGVAVPPDRSLRPAAVNRLARIFRGAPKRDVGGSASMTESDSRSDVSETMNTIDERVEREATVQPEPAPRPDIDQRAEAASALLPVTGHDERRGPDERANATDSPPPAAEALPARVGSSPVTETRQPERRGLVARIIGRRPMTPDARQTDAPAIPPHETRVAAPAVRTAEVAPTQESASRDLAVIQAAPDFVIRRTPSRMTPSRAVPADDGRPGASDVYAPRDYVRLQAAIPVAAKSLTMRTPVVVHADKPAEALDRPSAFAELAAPAASGLRAAGRVIARAAVAQPSTAAATAPAEPAGAAPAASATPEGGELQLSEGAIDRIARDVFDHLRRRLTLERERSGRAGRWDSI